MRAYSLLAVRAVGGGGNGFTYAEAYLSFTHSLLEARSLHDAI